MTRKDDKVATENADDAGKDKPKTKKKLLIIVIAAVVLLVGLGVGGFFFMKSRQAVDEESEEAPAAAAAKPKTPPAFLPLENMVVNLADPGGDRYAQIGITLELVDKKAEDMVKAYLPRIRSGILLIVSQKTAEELLKAEGKERLAEEIHAEVSAPLGFERPKDGAKDDKKGKSKKPDANPVRAVLFSSFIVQ